MIEAEVQLRKWGRSVGTVIPKEALDKEHLKAGQTVKLLIIKKTKTNPLKETFGTFKSKKSTAQLMREIDKECWDE